MKGDFSRDTFDPLRRFSRVLQQQGRVELDADWNEQTAILLHYTRTLGADLMGPHAGATKTAFAIGPAVDDAGNPVHFDLSIAAGSYYVDGIPCVNAQALRFTKAYPGSQPEAATYLAYLDAWERAVGYLEAPAVSGSGGYAPTQVALADAALGGVEASARAQIVWRMRLVDPAKAAVAPGVPVTDFAKDDAGHRAFLEFLRNNRLSSPGTGALAASVSGFTDPAASNAPTGYRGPDKQLSRIEIHRPGPAWSAQPGGVTKDKAATFKWSRENGSVAFAIASAPEPGAIGTTRVKVVRLGLDRRLDLEPGDWVELIDDDHALQRTAEPLLRVHDVDRSQLTVTLDGQPLTGLDMNKHPLLRRWDHGAMGSAAENMSAGAFLVQSEPTGKSLKLEHGLEVRFSSGADVFYQTGDYWLIAARTNGEIELSPALITDAASTPAPGYVAPRGEQHHYAPAAVVTFDAIGNLTAVSLRRMVKQLWDVVP